MMLTKERNIKRKNKILLILLLVLSLFTFVGCDKSGADGREYSILYVNDGIILDLQPYLCLYYTVIVRWQSIIFTRNVLN